MNKKVLSGLLVPAIALVLTCAMLIGAGGLFFKPSMQSGGGGAGGWGTGARWYVCVTSGQ